MSKILCLFLILCISCAKPVDIAATIDLPDLKNQKQLYIELSQAQARPHGFVEGCDGLLFTALGATGGMIADVEAALASPGKWLRRPVDQPNCYPHESESEISRDMLLGVIIWATYAKRLDVLKDLASYGKANNWVYGSGPASRTAMTPQMVGTLYMAIRALGGDYNVAILTPMTPDSSLTGYEAHLHVLHLWLRAQLGALTESVQAVLNSYADTNSHNAFYQAAAGRMERAGALMLTGSFPDGRLPASFDHCEPYLFQRQWGADWLPCDEGKVHTGADYIFVSWMITREVLPWQGLKKPRKW